jgi:hypothetical protein
MYTELQLVSAHSSSEVDDKVWVDPQGPIKGGLHGSKRSGWVQGVRVFLGGLGLWVGQGVRVGTGSLGHREHRQLTSSSLN